MFYICPMSVILLPYNWYTSTMHQSNICQISVKHMSNICQTSVKHLFNLCPPRRRDRLAGATCYNARWSNRQTGRYLHTNKLAQWKIPKTGTCRYQHTSILIQWKYQKLALADTYTLAYGQSERYLKLALADTNILAYWHSVKYLKLALVDTYTLVNWHSGIYLKLALVDTKILKYRHSGRYLKLALADNNILAYWHSALRWQIPATRTVADTYILALADIYIHRATFHVVSCQDVMSQIKPVILVENILEMFRIPSSNVHHAIAYQVVSSKNNLDFLRSSYGRSGARFYETRWICQLV